jgi:hypothetical protein
MRLCGRLHAKPRKSLFLLVYHLDQVCDRLGRKGVRADVMWMPQDESTLLRRRAPSDYLLQIVDVLGFKHRADDSPLIFAVCVEAAVCYDLPGASLGVFNRPCVVAEPFVLLRSPTTVLMASLLLAGLLYRLYLDSEVRSCIVCSLVLGGFVAAGRLHTLQPLFKNTLAGPKNRRASPQNQRLFARLNLSDIHPPTLDGQPEQVCMPRITRWYRRCAAKMLRLCKVAAWRDEKKVSAQTVFYNRDLRLGLTGYNKGSTLPRRILDR